VPNPVLQLAELLQDDPWLRERLFITCRGKTDGCGAQAHAVMSALAFAKAVGVRYLHSPFFRVAHGPKGVDWALQCESFFGLGNGEKNAGAATVPVEMVISKPRPLGRTVVEAPHYHAFLDRNPDFYRVIAPDLRRKYASSDKSELPLHHAAEGITIYEPFWHKPMSTWIVRDVAGRVDRAPLRSELCRALNLGLSAG